MYPLSTVVIGCDEKVLPHVRRELSNRSAFLEAEFSTAGAATEAMRRFSAEKRLLLLHMNSVRELDILGRLTVQFPSWPVVALVNGYHPKESLGEVVVGMMRAGASQILSLPIDPDDFQSALDRIAAQFVYSERSSNVIAVAGVTGGSGATTIALNLAYEIAYRHKLRCVLADLSLRIGVIAPHLNIQPTHSITDLLKDISRIDATLARKVLIKITDSFEILAGPHQFEQPIATSTDAVTRVVDTLKQMTDIVVLDVPCRHDDLYFDTLSGAAHTILVGEQKISSIRALKMVREAIGRPRETEHIVLNRFDPLNKGLSVQRILDPLGVSCLHTIARDDAGMLSALDNGCTLRLASPRSPALDDIVSLTDAVLSREDPPKTKTKTRGLLSRLGHALVHS
jgi:pilus assembly protein CpaE